MIAIASSAAALGYWIFPALDPDDDDYPAWMWVALVVPVVVGLTLVGLARAGVTQKGNVLFEAVGAFERTFARILAYLGELARAVVDTVTGVL